MTRNSSLQFAVKASTAKKIAIAAAAAVALGVTVHALRKAARDAAIAAALGAGTLALRKSAHQLTRGGRKPARRATSRSGR